MVKLRLKRCGRKKHATYRIVAMDVRSRRDGRELRNLGFYDPINNQTYLNTRAIIYFLERGAQPTETVRNILTKSQTVQDWLCVMKAMRSINSQLNNLLPKGSRSTVPFVIRSLKKTEGDRKETEGDG